LRMQKQTQKMAVLLTEEQYRHVFVQLVWCADNKATCNRIGQ